MPDISCSVCLRWVEFRCWSTGGYLPIKCSELKFQAVFCLCKFLFLSNTMSKVSWSRKHLCPSLKLWMSCKTSLYFSLPQGQRPRVTLDAGPLGCWDVISSLLLFLDKTLISPAAGSNYVCAVESRASVLSLILLPVENPGENAGGRGGWANVTLTGFSSKIQQGISSWLWLKLDLDLTLIFTWNVPLKCLILAVLPVNFFTWTKIRGLKHLPGQKAFPDHWLILDWFLEHNSSSHLLVAVGVAVMSFISWHVLQIFLLRIRNWNFSLRKCFSCGQRLFRHIYFQKIRYYWQFLQ